MYYAVVQKKFCFGKGRYSSLLVRAPRPSIAKLMRPFLFVTTIPSVPSHTQAYECTVIFLSLVFLQRSDDEDGPSTGFTIISVIVAIIMVCMIANEFKAPTNALRRGRRTSRRRESNYYNADSDDNGSRDSGSARSITNNRAYTGLTQHEIEMADFNTMIM